ncbi:MAG: type ISP restriction/modification enzyme [Candidatus Competibacteraceae bacterium]
MHVEAHWRELDALRRVAGPEQEGALSQAFAGLLKARAVEHQLVLSQQHPFPTPAGKTLRPDGALLDRVRLVHGWWEAKDSSDDLDQEIAAKLAKGYPSDNIVFEDTRTAVLIQNGREVMRVATGDGPALNRLLDGFFAFRPPEVAHFDQATARFRAELPTVIAALNDLLTSALTDEVAFQQRFAAFIAQCQYTIGARVTAGQAREMLIQHILTEQIFRDIFPVSEFHRANHLARALTELENAFLRGEARRNLLIRLEPYYAAIRRTAAGAISAAEKQEFLKAIYEDFYTAYNPRDADKLGVVYTPGEVVRFILAGCDWLARRHFGKGLSDPELDILDPCTGTGTFIVELLDWLRGDRAALARKYADEIHANEIAILPYYIACLNIEQTYAEITGTWREFAGACFVDTLANWGFELTHRGAQSDLFGALTEENRRRIQHQNTRRIPVILGNPPYNANQRSENENNKNDPAPIADARIRETYLAESSAQKTKLYDPYIRFFRWASDRIGPEGIVGFVTNRSYLDGRHADGLRKAVTKEFQEIWIVDLRSDVRRNPKISGTKNNIFGIQTGVAIGFFVRNPKLEGCEIRHIALDDFMTAMEKRRWLAAHPLRQLARAGELSRVRPNARGDWLDQPTADWSAFLPVADKAVKAGPSEQAIFRLFASSIKTNRDDWVYDFDQKQLKRKVQYFIAAFNRQIASGDLNPDTLDYSIKWSSTLKTRHKLPAYSANRLLKSLWRPFVIRHYYAEKTMSDRLTALHYQIHGADLKQDSLCIGISGGSAMKPFQALALRGLADYECVEKNQLLPLWVYAPDGSRQDNITDWALTRFRVHYQDQSIEKKAVFEYVYAVLHDPAYRETYALNLKTEFPRIPFYGDFRQWTTWGKALLELHTGFENVEPWPLVRKEDRSVPPAPPKPRLKADKVAGAIEIDSVTRLEGVPPEAWEYRLGNRSALEWILEEYQETTPRDPTLRDQFNTYRFADHKEPVIDLLRRVTRVSVETMRILHAMSNAAPESRNRVDAGR